MTAAALRREAGLAVISVDALDKGAEARREAGLADLDAGAESQVSGQRKGTAYFWEAW